MIEAMKQALEALERSVATCFDQYAHQQAMSQPDHFINQSITSLRQAIANEALNKKAENARELGLDYEPSEQEPVAWKLIFDNGHTEITTRPVAEWKRLMWESAGKRWSTQPLYTHPQPKQWVGLNWDDLPEIYVGDKAFLHGAKWAEAKLKEKA